MHTIDLNKFNTRTDLIIEKNIDLNTSKRKIDNNINVTSCIHENEKYITIEFNDITDKNNYIKVQDVFINEIKELLPNISNKTILIIGLGNSSSTPDSLGPKTIDNILVTNHLFMLGDVEEGYERVAVFKPQVMAQTGIETSDIIKEITKVSKADILIVIDALASSSITRVNKTIQITTSGIHPGSGVGNDRKEISKKILGIPVIAIGVPTIVDYASIVTDTLTFLNKKISFNKENINNNKLKLIPANNINYLESDQDLTNVEKEKILGIIGTLTKGEQKQLIDEVLTPINYNLMVTPKEIDYVIEKLSSLIGKGLNISIHKNYNRQNI